MSDTRLSGAEMAAWSRLAAVLELLPGQLDLQLRRDADLTHFDYLVLATLSEAEASTMRMTAVAAQTNASLARLSNVVKRLEARGLVRRTPCPSDARATNLALTACGEDDLRRAAPGHVATVRRLVMDALTPAQVEQLTEIGDAILARLDPGGTYASSFRAG